MPTIEIVAADLRKKLAGNAAIDIEYLARLFEDRTIADTATGGNELQNRTATILAASADPSRNAGITHFSGIFKLGPGVRGDHGFSSNFQDPWPQSSNQMGHFCTAVDMGANPAKALSYATGRAQAEMVLRATTEPGWAILRSHIPEDEKICISLMIGHEKVGDQDFHANERAAVLATPQEIMIFWRALALVPLTPSIDVSPARAALGGIHVGNGIGNSVQDLLLSLYGFAFGKFIRTGRMTKLAEAAAWLWADIGGVPYTVVTPSFPPLATGGAGGR